MREAAADLAVDHRRMQDGSAVVHGDVAVDPRLQGGPVDLDAAEVKDKAVAKRGVDVILLVRRGQLRRGPEHGFANRVSDTVGQRRRRPMTQPRDTGERKLVVRIALRSDMAADECDILDLRVQLAGGDARQSLRYSISGKPCGAGN